MPKPDNVESYNDLARLTVPRLRELASADTELKNTVALEKPALLEALCSVYGFELPTQKKAEGIKRLKAQMKGVKKQRDEMLAVAPKERDKKQLELARKRIRTLKRKMRKLAAS